MNQLLRNAARLVRRNDGFDFMNRPAPAGAEGVPGFHQSSFDLRTGLEVIEETAATLPMELEVEFTRQRQG